MELISLNLEHTYKFVDSQTCDQYLQIANEKNLILEQKTGPGREFLGWLNLPSKTPKTLINDIKQTVENLRQNSDYLIVIGIGGSYLGAKATISALSKFFGTSNIIFAGFNLSEKYLYELTKFIEDKEFSLCVISKSGKTLEPAVSFRVLRELAYKKYGDKARERIIAINNPHGGALLNLAKQNGYKTFAIPDDVGGRYSVLTPVGLVPIAFAGFDIELLLDGARIMEIHSASANKGNMPELYATARNALYNKGFNIEILTTYSPELEYVQRWWQQLFGESEGKENKGIFPAIATFTTDLHSLGQYIQQGPRNLFETVIFNHHKPDLIKINQEPVDFDELNFLSGKTIEYINEQAFLGTVQAHVDGGVPNIIINMPKINEFTLGQLFYFFERSCAISGYMLGVNPFDQPGVEAYKRNMFRLLGKKM